MAIPIEVIVLLAVFGFTVGVLLALFFLRIGARADVVALGSVLLVILLLTPTIKPLHFNTAQLSYLHTTYLPSTDAGTPFIITGVLTDGFNGTPLVGQTIELLQKLNDKYEVIGEGTTITTGEVSFTLVGSTSGTYYYRLVYNGNETYSPAVSDWLTVSVSTTPTLMPSPTLSMREVANMSRPLSTSFSTSNVLHLQPAGNTSIVQQTAQNPSPTTISSSSTSSYNPSDPLEVLIRYTPVFGLFVSIGSLFTSMAALISKARREGKED
jgi:hypothetical protein